MTENIVVEDVMENIYKKNKSFIEENKLHVGGWIITQSNSKSIPVIKQITNIHPDYFWICDMHGQIDIDTIKGACYIEC